MPQENDIIQQERAQTTAVESEALNIIEADMQTGDKPLPPPAEAMPSNTSAQQTARDSRRTARAEARRARTQLYGDQSVPRVLPQRRYGGSSHSRAYLKQELALYSDRAQRFFERNYEQVNMSLIVSTLVTEAIGGSELAQKISVYIEQQFRTLEAEMLEAIKELKRGASESGIPEENQVPAYDHKRFYNPPIHTPHSAQFMTVVSLYDRIVARAEACWINRVMNSQTRYTIVLNWQRRLRDFVRELFRIRGQALKEARKAGFARRAAAIEESVRREQTEEPLEKADVKTTAADNSPEAGLARKQEASQKVSKGESAASAEAASDAAAEAAGSSASETPAQRTDAPQSAAPASEADAGIPAHAA